MQTDNNHPHGLSQTQLSHTIGLARIMLIIGLVFLHYGSFPNSTANPFRGMDIDFHPFATWANSTILFFFFSVVPLLSMVSGWLFFSFMPDDAWASIKRRMRRRGMSLFLPMVVWNASYLGVLYALYLVKPEASVFNYTNRLNIGFDSAGLMQYLNAIFAINAEPLAFQFWFVRDLFVSTLVSPIMWLMIRRAPWLGAAALCLVWLSGSTLGIFLRADVPFFFYMGALIKQKHLPVTISLRTTLVLVIIYTIYACLRALEPYLVPASAEEPFWLEVVTRSMRIVGVIGCWGLFYRWAQTSSGIFISAFGGLAFFLHSAHWPLLSVIKVMLWRFVPMENDFWMLVHYGASVVATTAICIAAGIVLARKAPRIFAFMNGGRDLGQEASHKIQAKPSLSTAL